MRLLLLGADGQVGHALRRALAPLGEVLPCTVSGRLPEGDACEPADFCAPGALAAAVERLRPDWVINAAAYTAVDKAESEPALAHRINAEAVAELASACAAHDIGLVHYSTDYIFPGDGQRPYREDDAAGPLGVYGASKWAGEQAVRASGARHRIFRLCWVYGAHGHNFLKTMLRLAGERDELRVVADQIGTPTPASWIADATAQSLRVDSRAVGTWHLAASGETSWHGFASAIIDRAAMLGLLSKAPSVCPIMTVDYPTPAKRPAYSRLDCSALARDFAIQLPDWQVGLKETLAALVAGS